MHKAFLLIGVLLIGSSMAATFCPRNQDQTNIFSFFKGFIETLQIGLQFEEINNCLYTLSDSQNSQLLTNITNAMSSLGQINANASNSSNSSTVSQTIVGGLADIAAVHQAVPNAMTSCNIPAPYVNAIKEMLGNFTISATANVPTITVQNIDISAEIKQAVANWSVPAYYKTGAAMAVAMARVYWGRFMVTESATVAALNGGNWTATGYSQYNNMNLWDFKKMINLRYVRGVVSSGDPPANDTTPPPSTLDGRIEWPNCVHAIRDSQGQGTAWAIQAAEVLSDRFCIKTARTVNSIFSIQYMLSCQNSALDTDMYSSWKFLEYNGDVPDTCLPYTPGTVNSCSSYTKCADNKQPVKYHIQINSTKWFTNPTQIMSEIFQNGPVEASMYVYSDFPYYQNGFYIHKSGLFLGAHPVRIIGWGLTGDNSLYWIAANTWGTNWGMSGFFQIMAGEVGIDSQAIAGVVDLSACDT